jgi:dihydroxyacetone kinase
MKKIENEPVALVHEKMRSARIRKANNKVLDDLLETKTNLARSVTGDQLNEIQRDIESQTQAIQELYYQNTKNELLQKEYKNAMEISHIKAANTSLENNILVQINNITAHINHLESQLQASEQRNTQIMSESNEHRIKTFEHQANLELKIAQLEQEKTNLIAMVQQLQDQI